MKSIKTINKLSMKKSVLFITLVGAMIGFALMQNAKNDSPKEQVANQAFKDKWKNKEASALGHIQYRQEMLKNVETGEINPQDYYTALGQVEALKASNTANKTDVVSLDWISRGPDSQGGRTRAILFDKDDENLMFTGSVSGGLFKSTDGGDSWARIPSFFENNASIMSIAQSQDGTIFVGTGEALAGNLPTGTIFNSAITGSGIYKSSDLGATWTSIDVTNEFTYPTFSGQWSSVRKMAAHPALSNILLAGNNAGLRISTNANDLQPTFSNISGVTGNVSDVAITIDGKDGWAAASGRIYKSNGTSLSDPWVLKSPSVSAARAQIAISTVDANGDYIVYASFTTSPGCLAGVFKTEDKGTSWTQIIFPGGADPFAQPSSNGGTGGCQGWYDHCIAVNPVDKDKIYIGGITFYTWGSGSGGLQRADQIDYEGASALDPDYIHADKHQIVLSPHDPTGNTMFIVGDGGINRCLNANSGFPDNLVFSENNRNYTTLQCYSIGSGKYGEVIAGAQDNGTQYVDYKGISPKAAKEVSGGDGVGGACISNFNIDAMFSGSQDGHIRRSMTNGNSSGTFLSPVIDPAFCGNITCGTFSTPQTCDDVTGQGFIYHFLLMETYDRLAPRFDAYIYARDETILLPGGDIISIKDTIEAGDVIDHPQFKIEKIPTMDFEGLNLTYDLPVQLMPGDTHFFLNKFDTKYFVPSTCGSNRFFVCSNPVQVGKGPIFSEVSIPGQSSIRKMDYSYDGDMLAGVGGSSLIVSQGWDAFEPDSSSSYFNMSSVTSKIIPIGVSNMSGVAIDKNDKDRILVTQAGYGGTNKVFLVTNINATSPTVTPVQGNLPIMPVYSCVIDIEDGNKFIVGTELGIFISEDAGVTWTEANNGMGARMPIFDLRQKWVNNFDCHLLSAGSLGGGMFTCESLSSCAGNIVYGRPESTVGINKIPTVEVHNVLVYPNPVSEIAKIAFTLTENADITIKIVDLVGKVVLTKNYNGLVSGDQSLEMNVSNLASSSYFTVISSGNRTYGNKMFVKK